LKMILALPIFHTVNHAQLYKKKRSISFIKTICNNNSVLQSKHPLFYIKNVLLRFNIK